jgi:hypothetical protein
LLNPAANKNTGGGQLSAAAGILNERTHWSTSFPPPVFHRGKANYAALIPLVNALFLRGDAFVAQLPTEPPRWPGFRASP